MSGIDAFLAEAYQYSALYGLASVVQKAFNSQSTIQISECHAPPEAEHSTLDQVFRATTCELDDPDEHLVSQKFAQIALSVRLNEVPDGVVSLVWSRKIFWRWYSHRRHTTKHRITSTEDFDLAFSRTAKQTGYSKPKSSKTWVSRCYHSLVKPRPESSRGTAVNDFKPPPYDASAPALEPIETKLAAVCLNDTAKSEPEQVNVLEHEAHQQKQNEDIKSNYMQNEVTSQASERGAKGATSNDPVKSEDGFWTLDPETGRFYHIHEQTRQKILYPLRFD